jgi:hypothetical protein
MVADCLDFNDLTKFRICSEQKGRCSKLKSVKTTFPLYRCEKKKHEATSEPDLNGKLADSEYENLCEDYEERFYTEMHKYLNRCIQYHQKHFNGVRTQKTTTDIFTSNLQSKLSSTRSEIRCMPAHSTRNINTENKRQYEYAHYYMSSRYFAAPCYILLPTWRPC